VGLTLEAIRSSLEGAIPAIICTVDADGTPNVTNLSIVSYVDGAHVALSCQFFNKTRINIQQNPRAQVLVVEPGTMRQFRLDLVFERSETSGPVFERMSVRLAAIASQTGMSRVFRLHSADLYRVLECAELPAEDATPTEDVPWSSPSLEAVASLNESLSAATDLDGLVSAAVEGLAQTLGYEHVVLMLSDETGERLLTVASHGYPSSGAGAEVLVGQGVWGVAAQRKRPIRISDLNRELLYSQAVRRSVESLEGGSSLEREIPLPGLEHPASLLAVPLVYRGELQGLIGVESPLSMRLHHQDEAAVQVVGGHLAVLIEGALAASTADTRAVAAGGATPAGRPIRLRYHADDDSVFIDDKYLIKGLSGRLLHRLVRIFLTEGRTDFCNREVRLDPHMRLSTLRDNLETRIILLRRRLEDRQAPLRLERIGRGQFRLHVDGSIDLADDRQGHQSGPRPAD
jgi:adenylate cyclase